MSNPDYQDPQYALQGDPNQYPRFLSAPIYGGFNDVVGLVQHRANGPLVRINKDGSEGASINMSWEDYRNQGCGIIRQVSGMYIAALIYQHTGGNL